VKKRLFKKKKRKVARRSTDWSSAGCQDKRWGAGVKAPRIKKAAIRWHEGTIEIKVPWKGRSKGKDFFRVRPRKLGEWSQVHVGKKALSKKKRPGEVLASKKSG